MTLFLILGILGCKGTDAEPDTGVCSLEEMGTTYTRYVEPFVSGAVESSCTQCHMTGIDITMYAQDTPCQTLACMVDAGVVNLENPESSALLDQIRMGETASSVFDVEKEADAFLAWIEWSAECHDEACGVLESPCTSGTGAASTGVDPLGDCSESDLLAVFWDSVIIDRKRCNTCHSQWAEDNTTYGPCTSDEDCEEKIQCLAGYCKMPGAYKAPHYFEGLEDSAKWNVPEDQEAALNTMYNVAALGALDPETPLSSFLLVKPLLEGFQPSAIYGPGVSIDSVPVGEGVGLPHQGKSKFNFGYPQEQPPTTGVIDCRQEQACDEDGDCDNGKFCRIPEEEHTGWCHLDDSLCDETYVKYVRFVQYFAQCN
jgi:hypothetical protein